MKAGPIKICRDGDVPDQVLVGQDLGLQQVELRLCERTDSLREGFFVTDAPVLQNLVIECLELITVSDIVPEHLFRTLE